MMIQVDRLTKYFGPVLALNEASFSVEANEIVGLLGNNGAGKTTLMRMLTTYLPATSGIARVAGYDVMTQSLEVRQRIGYLPESIPLYPEMRVEEYLHFRARLKGVDRAIRKIRVEETMERCRVGEVRRRLLGTLSKGYRQRVGLADALLANPPLLILDEPTDGLDPGQKQETLAFLRELGKNHTILFSSHLLTEVEELVQRVIILKRGRVGLVAKMSELENEPVVLVEVAAPAQEALRGVLEKVEGVVRCGITSTGSGSFLCEVRTKASSDPREALAARILGQGWGLRRLERSRRTLLDKWNEINNQAEEAKASLAS
jgi:ABC-2 type transport system ATP-binding protein